MGRLSGKVAIVTGAASGQGKATAKLMAREGAQVVVADINSGGAERVVAEIRDAGGEAIACQVDIADEAHVAKMVAATVERFGGLDILHNNAAALDGELIALDTAQEISDLDMSVWDRVMAVNVRGYVLCTKYAIREMLKRGGGSIINTSSAVALAAEPTRCCYQTSKSALHGLARYVAAAYGKRGIRCNVIAPGTIVNPEKPDRMAPAAMAMRLRHTLTPRLGTPQDIANAVVFLASDDAAFVTGQVICVDGGMLAHIPAYADMLEGGAATDIQVKPAADKA